VAAAFGRQERFQAEGRSFTILLAKNPTGFNSVLHDSVELGRGKRYLLALNDRIADGTDVSWIWDVDFEVLKNRVEAAVPSGDRAHDLAVRLKYAEVKGEAPEPNLARALDRVIELTPEGEHAFLLCTYTAMLDLRAILVRRGWLRPYWAT
jgi:UDP-N-acetylmuramyl tripeptide synthase